MPEQRNRELERQLRENEERLTRLEWALLGLNLAEAARSTRRYSSCTTTRRRLLL